MFRYGIALAVAWSLLVAAPMALTLLGTGLALGLWGLLTLGVFVNNEPLDNPLGLLLMPFLWPFSVSRGGSSSQSALGRRG